MDKNPKISKRTNSATKVVDYLNSALKADPGAIHALCCIHVPCNKKLVDHPHVVVHKSNTTNTFNVGMLGVMNGLMTSLGLPRIAMKWMPIAKSNNFEFKGFIIADIKCQPKCDVVPIKRKRNK